MSDDTWRDETLRDLVISASHIVSAAQTCDCPDEGHQNTLHDLAHDVLRILGQDADGGQANDCPHYSATGIDTAPVGPGKVWRCDHCGLTWTDSGDGRRAALANECEASR